MIRMPESGNNLPVMLTFRILKSQSDLTETLSETELASFLHRHLGRFGDAESAIRKAIRYALSDAPGKGGFILTGYEGGELVAVLVMNRTGMTDYIPENHLVYVAVDGERRSRGIGRRMIERAVSECDGDVAMHVEPDNPARRLYEKIGFKEKYVEMRYLRLGRT